MKTKIISQIDWILVGLYFLLVFLGWSNIYASVYNPEQDTIFDFSQRHGKQLIWIMASLFIIVGVFILNSRVYAYFAYPTYLFFMLLLLAVLIFGKEIKGAKSWIELGAFRLQPAEFAKVATLLAMAKTMASHSFKLSKWKHLLLLAAVILLPAGLILLQNDTGSALVYSVLILVLYREGLPGIVLVLLAYMVVLFIITLIFGINISLIGVLLLSLLVLWNILPNKKIGLIYLGILTLTYSLFYASNSLFELQLSAFSLYFMPFLISSLYLLELSFRKNIKSLYLFVLSSVLSLLFVFSVDYVFNSILIQHQRDRINNLLGIEFDPLGAGYNVNQSLIAIGSGGVTGKGFLQGTQTKFNFVPEQTTDFIFCTVGEEWGFLGASAIILLFLFFLIRIIIIAERQKAKFSRIYAYGVASIFFFHIAINIGMTIGLAPVIGIPLPFFSYGGSSFWAFTLLLFILIKLDADRNNLII